MVNDSLIKRGVNLVLGERVDDVEPKDGKLITRSGKEIPADLVVRLFLFRFPTGRNLTHPRYRPVVLDLTPPSSRLRLVPTS